MDITEIEVAKIREAEATKRHAIEIKARAADDRRDRWLKFFDGNDGAMALLVIGGLGVVVTLGVIACMFTHARLYH